MKKIVLLSIIFISAAFVGNAQNTPTGTLVDVIVHSPGVEGNIMDLSPDRDVKVYLPPGYDANTNLRYPVIYILHPGGARYTDDIENVFFNKNGINIKGILDDLMATGKAAPMIFVAPDACTGAYFTNSVTQGNWEDFVVYDLVEYIDNNFRTLADVNSRGITGWSMGGMGAIKFAMKHPDVFSSVYGQHSAPFNFKNQWMFESFKLWTTAAVKADSLPSEDDMNANTMYYQALSWSPNLNTPFYCDLPFTEEGELIDSVWQKWLQHDIYELVPDYVDNLNKLNGIVIETSSVAGVTLKDRINQALLARLENLGIEHSSVINTTSVSNKTIEINYGKYIVPFFTDTLFNSFVKLNCPVCLSQTDTVIAETGKIDSIVYVVPANSYKDLSSIEAARLTSKIIPENRNVSVPYADFAYGDYFVFSVSKEGIFGPPERFSINQTTPKITLQVKDYHTDVPVPGCTVKISGTTFQTDTEGEVTAEGCGDQNITVQAEDYSPFVSTFKIYNDTTLEIRVISTINVRVENKSNGIPVIGALINYGDSRVFTDVNGNATLLGVTEDTVACTVENRDFFTEEDNVVIDNRDETIVIRLTPLKATIQFQVNDEQGPLYSQTVNLNAYSGKTNSSGIAKFNFQNARQMYYYAIDRACYNPVEDSLYLENDTVININLEPDTISPVLQNLQQGEGIISATCSKSGDVYIVPVGTEAHVDSIKKNELASVSVSKGEMAEFTHSDFELGEYWFYAIDHCEKVSLVKSFVVTGLNEHELKIFRLYPNPANEILNMELRDWGKYHLELLALNGQIIIHSQFTGDKSILDVSKLESGIYIIKLKSEKTSVTKKFIKY